MKIEELINVISSGANDTLKNAINEFNADYEVLKASEDLISANTVISNLASYISVDEFEEITEIHDKFYDYSQNNRIKAYEAHTQMGNLTSGQFTRLISHIYADIFNKLLENFTEHEYKESAEDYGFENITFYIEESVPIKDAYKESFVEVVFNPAYLLAAPISVNLAFDSLSKKSKEFLFTNMNGYIISKYDGCNIVGSSNEKILAKIDNILFDGSYYDKLKDNDPEFVTSYTDNTLAINYSDIDRVLVNIDDFNASQLSTLFTKDKEHSLSYEHFIEKITTDIRFLDKLESISITTDFNDSNDEIIVVKFKGYKALAYINTPSCAVYTAELLTHFMKTIKDEKDNSYKLSLYFQNSSHMLDLGDNDIFDFLNDIITKERHHKAEI
jgi:hypothetical protein